MSQQNVQWQWSRFDELTRDELYEILSARQQVFVVEQKCFALDADGLDPKAMHLLGWMPALGKNGRTLIAYLRAFAPGIKVPDASFGRVLTAADVRGKGFGKLIVAEGIKRMAQTFGSVPLKIAAQSYLEHFYSEFGFKTFGAPFEEGGLPHINMRREA